ncbi:MAG: tetratricopeptide repeat protein [Acidobacteriota bacterium]
MSRTVVFAFLALSTLSFHAAAQNAGKAAEIYNRALELQQAGDTQNALAAYDRAIALNPKMLDAYNNRATIKLAAGDSAGAIADLTKVIELSPKHPLSFYNRGCIYLDMQTMDAAIDDFTKAIDIFSGVTHGGYDKRAHAMSYNNRGNALMSKGKAKEAMSDYEMSLTIIPNNFEALTGRGTVKQSLEDYAGAVADYSKALEIAPKSVVVLMNRAGALEQIDKAAAVNDYTRVIELQPENAQAYAARGVALLELGRKSAAVADLRKALQMDPSLRTDYEAHLKEALKK